MNFKNGMPKGNNGPSISDMLRETLSSTNPKELIGEVKNEVSSILTHPFGFPMTKIVETTMLLFSLTRFDRDSQSQLLHNALEWRITSSFQEIANNQDGIPELETTMSGIIAAYMLFMQEGLPSFMDLSTSISKTFPEDIDMVILENTEKMVDFILIPDLNIRIMTTGGRKNADLLAGTYGFEINEEFTFEQDNTKGWGFRLSKMPYNPVGILEAAKL